MTASFQVQGNAVVTYEWIKTTGHHTTRKWADNQPACRACGRSGLPGLNVCSGEIIATSSPANGLTCQNTTSWKSTSGPHPFSS